MLIFPSVVVNVISGSRLFSFSPPLSPYKFLQEHFTTLEVIIMHSDCISHPGKVVAATRTVAAFKDPALVLKCESCGVIQGKNENKRFILVS